MTANLYCNFVHLYHGKVAGFAVNICGYFWGTIYTTSISNTHSILMLACRRLFSNNKLNTSFFNE